VGSFAPWIAFLILARDTVLRVEVGLLVALGLSVVMALLRLNRGIIMYIGLAFFTAATIAVLAFHDMWTLKYLGVLANGALALGSWITLLIGKPFTLEYARQHTDPARWNDPLFIRTNVQLKAVWAAAFTFNTAVAWVLMQRLLPQWVCQKTTYAVFLGCRRVHLLVPQPRSPQGPGVH
jgi:hypothetical protein